MFSCLRKCHVKLSWVKYIIIIIIIIRKQYPYGIPPLNSSTTGWAWSHISWLYTKLLTSKTCCWVIAWIFCGMHTFTGEVIALEPEEALPFLEGVVIASLLPLLPTLPTLPEGDGVGERGDGVPVVLWTRQNNTLMTKAFSISWDFSAIAMLRLYEASWLLYNSI